MCTRGLYLTNTVTTMSCSLAEWMCEWVVTNERWKMVESSIELMLIPSVQSYKFYRDTSIISSVPVQVPFQHIYSIVQCLVGLSAGVFVCAPLTVEGLCGEILSTGHLIATTWRRVCCLLKDFRQFSTLFMFHLHKVRLFHSLRAHACVCVCVLVYKRAHASFSQMKYNALQIHVNLFKTKNTQKNWSEIPLLHSAHMARYV